MSPRFLVQKLFRALVTIWIIVTFVFIVLRLSGDSALLIYGPDVDAEAITALREAWGLNKPIWQQYLIYFKNIFQGDFGKSYLDGRSALAIVGERIPKTLSLMGITAMITFIIGIPAGILLGLPGRPEVAEHLGHYLLVEHASPDREARWRRLILAGAVAAFPNGRSWGRSCSVLALLLLAKLIPPVGRRSCPLGRLLDVVHEIRLWAPFEERWAHPLDRRQRNVCPDLDKVWFVLANDAANGLCVEADCMKRVVQR